MSKTRREILEASLAKKDAKFNASLEAHMSDVRGAQGEPMAGHRGGEKVLSRWNKQNNSLRFQQESIDKTKTALEREDWRDAEKLHANEVLLTMPQIIQEMTKNGKLNQWAKHPTIFFVNGVKKSRIQIKKGKAHHRFARQCENEEQFQKFRTVYNEINKAVN